MVTQVGLNGQANNLASMNETSKNLAFRATSNTLERIPQDDSFEKKGMGTGAKVTIGAAIILGLGIAGDFIFAKGKHVKKLLGMADDVEKKVSGTAEEVAHNVQNKTDDVVSVVETNIIESEKLIKYTDDELQGLLSKNVNDLSSEEQKKLLNTILPEEDIVARKIIEKYMNMPMSTGFVQGSVQEYLQGLNNIKENLGEFIGKENVLSIFKNKNVLEKPLKDLKLGDVIVKFDEAPGVFGKFNKDTDLVSFLKDIGDDEFKKIVQADASNSLLESNNLLSYLVHYYNS